MLYSLYSDSSINVQESCFILGLFVHCLENCCDKSNVFALLEKEIRVNFYFFLTVLFQSLIALTLKEFDP